MNKIISLDSLQHLVINPLKRLIDKKVDKIYVDTVVTEIPRIDKTDRPHQQLVTDTDGNIVWENRTHYTEKQQVTLLEDGGFAYKDGTGGIYMGAPTNTPVGVLTVGAECTVRFNGETFKFTAFAWPELVAMGGVPEDSVFAGNWGMYGRTGLAMEGMPDDTGEPVAVLIGTQNGILTSTVISDIFPETIGIDVLQEVKVPLDAGYIPSGIGGGTTEAVWFNLDYKTMGATCNYTYDQVA